MMVVNVSAWVTWDIVTGKAKLILGPAPPGTHPDVKGVQPFGTNEAHVYTDRVKNNLEAAGVAAHEITHVQQQLTPQTYRKSHEVDAFKAQRAVDSDLAGWTDNQIVTHVYTHPVYQHVPP
jgi:hypothetical protein